MENAPGRGLIRTAGILYIIVAGFGILGSIILIAGGGLFAAGMSNSSAGAVGAIVMFAAFFALAIAVLELVLAIFAVRNAGNVMKANALFIWGIVLAALQVISLLMNFTFWGILYLAPPVLLIIGAYQNKQQMSSGV